MFLAKYVNLYMIQISSDDFPPLPPLLSLPLFQEKKLSKLLQNYWDRHQEHHPILFLREIP